MHDFRKGLLRRPADDIIRLQAQSICNSLLILAAFCCSYFVDTFERKKHSIPARLAASAAVRFCSQGIDLGVLALAWLSANLVNCN